MVLIETVGQKTKIRDSETSRPKIRDSETKGNTRKRDFETHSPLPRFRGWNKNFRDHEFSAYHSPPLTSTVLSFWIALRLNHAF